MLLRFHEWPEEALMSVSMKFMQVETSIPEANKKSICQFMSYVHQSVNDMSKVYAQNDKRFNYTTPKSFLELINLYRKVLTNKNNELYGKIDRLGNGLEKLRGTGSQVDELKAQLALQEVELAKKVSISIKPTAPVGQQVASLQNDKLRPLIQPFPKC